MFPAVILPLALLALSGFMIDQHRKAWREARADANREPRELRFERRRYRRRMVASSAIGLIGALLAVRPAVPERPGWFAAYLAALLLACVLLILLGLGDALASGMHFRQQTNRRQAKLAKEILRQHRENQKADEA